MGVRMVKSVVRAVAGIDEASWTPIDYSADGEAEVAECEYNGQRLIVRRTRLTGPQATLWPEWRHFAFVTDLEGKAVDVDAFHRRMRQSSSPFATCKKALASSTCRRGTSSPTPLGSCAPRSPTTSSAGPPCSANSP